MKKIFFVLALLTTSAAVSAAQFTDFYVVPAAAHAAGANGTMWLTDVAIQNINDTPVTIEMAVVESGEGARDNVFPVAMNGGTSVTVPANGSVLLRDVLANQRGNAQTIGALLIGGDQPFALTSRTYDQTSNGTFGQTVTPASDVTSGDSKLFIPGIVSNAAFRTNLGLVMVATTPLTVTVTLNDANGNALGTRTFNVAAGAATHVQLGVPAISAAPFDAGGAVVEITSGDGTVVAYASVIDNLTNDASFISAGSAANAAGSERLRSVLSAARR